MRGTLFRVLRLLDYVFITLNRDVNERPKRWKLLCFFFSKPGRLGHQLLKNNNGFLYKNFHKSLLTQSNTTLTKYYGLPKIHKVDVPLRPIVSLINSPTYFLAKILYQELKTAIPKAS